MFLHYHTFLCYNFVSSFIISTYKLVYGTAKENEYNHECNISFKSCVNLQFWEQQQTFGNMCPVSLLEGSVRAGESLCTVNATSAAKSSTLGPSALYETSGEIRVADDLRRPILFASDFPKHFGSAG